jgi:hypothetical protein
MIEDISGCVVDCDMCIFKFSIYINVGLSQDVSFNENKNGFVRLKTGSSHYLPCQGFCGPS